MNCPRCGVSLSEAEAAAQACYACRAPFLSATPTPFKWERVGMLVKTAPDAATNTGDEARAASIVSKHNAAVDALAADAETLRVLVADVSDAIAEHCARGGDQDYAGVALGECVRRLAAEVDGFRRAGGIDVPALRAIVNGLKQRTWLSPLSADEVNYRDRWLIGAIEQALGAAKETTT